MTRRPVGWRNESARHSLASRGIKSAQKIPKPRLSARKQVQDNYEQYILDDITDQLEGEGITNLTTKKQKLQYAWDRFYNETGRYDIPRYRGNTQEAVRQWLMGLAMGFPHMNADVVQLAKDMGSIPKDMPFEEADKRTENYWNFMANQMMRVWEKNGIDTSKR